MKIENYISQLLYRYHCVTIPNFGAFLTEIQSAKIDEATATFFPPNKTLSFNSYLQNNDGLLANHISQVEKITYDEAVGYIKIQVLNWKEKLNLFGLLAIKNIGEFTLNSDNKLVFKPFSQLNYLTDSFGLSSYSVAEIQRKTIRITPEIAPVKDLISVETSAKPYEIVTANETPIITLPLQKSKPNYLKYAAGLIIGFGLIGTAGYKIYENKVAAETLIVQTKVQQLVNKKIQEATFLIEIPAASVKMSVAGDKLPFHIVAGAFRSEKNANKELKDLIAAGFDAKRLEKNRSNLYPVAYCSYASYAEAHEEMAKIRKNNPAAWVLIEE